MSLLFLLNPWAAFTIVMISLLGIFLFFLPRRGKQPVLEFGEFVQTVSFIVGTVYSVHTLCTLSEVTDLGPHLSYILTVGLYSTATKLSCQLFHQFSSSREAV